MEETLETTASETAQAQEIHIPRWRVRLNLFWKGFRSNWVLFTENPIGLIGLGVIAFFGLLSLAHPILMATVWSDNVYDPVVGIDLEIPFHPSPPSPRARPPR